MGRSDHRAPDDMAGWIRYDHRDLHWRLISQTDTQPDPWVPGQAIVCPYYVPLEGKLGADWGVIVNPQSTRFGLLTFEHADCGCPDRVPDMDGPIHVGTPDQSGDMWDLDWLHVHDELCDDECPW